MSDLPIDPSADAAAGDPAASAAAAAKTKSARPARRPQQAMSGRRRAREHAVQGLYQWLVSGAAAGEIEAHIREQDEFEKCDRAHFNALLHGCIAEAAALDAALARHVDRKTTDLSPMEHAVLMIGAYELAHCIDIPYRVVINEAVELAKSFGGTDGHKYVNGVLDKTASDLRPVEVKARQAARPAR